MGLACAAPPPPLPASTPTVQAAATQIAPTVSAAQTQIRRSDEFVAVTGYDRKYAIRLLLGPIRPPAPIRRPRGAVRTFGRRATALANFSYAQPACTVSGALARGHGRIAG